MRKFVKSRVVDWTFAAIVSYWLVAPFPDMENVTLLLSGSLMAIWLGILIGYAPVVWAVVRDPKNPLGTQIMLMGAAVVALGITGIFGWAAAYSFLDQPVWMRMHIFRGWFQWMVVVGAAEFLIAGGIRNVESAKHMARIVAAALVITVLVVWLAGGIG